MDVSHPISSENGITGKQLKKNKNNILVNFIADWLKITCVKMMAWHGW